MKTIKNYTKFIPYLYFIFVAAYCFTIVNRTEGFTAYPILLLSIPFLYQLVKPSRSLNFTLGITFVCISSYLIMVFISDSLNIISISEMFNKIMIYGGLLAFLSFIMSLWMIRNSLKETF
ncbi:hypothetical protein [Hyunsoonleella aestuarii]|uniref:Uncharacterized protein n=1 Tax=Hyunsoonleella aestuarii TaxID=912802 RepID=A0ABP8E7T8_9FLAO|nr:hypothetical protein [Hyunsoonleella aestuarii]